MRARAWLAVSVVVFALVFAGAAILLAVQTNSDKNAELCEFVDNEHNKDRAEIVKAERELYNPPPTQPPSFRRFIEPFIDTAVERQALHAVNEKSYAAIRKTRPDYCAKVRKNPVKPYPKLEELR